MDTRRLGPVAVTAALALLAAGCGSRGAKAGDANAGGTLTLGASLSLTGSLVHEGKLTQAGYDVCVKVVNDKGGVKTTRPRPTRQGSSSTSSTTRASS